MARRRWFVRRRRPPSSSRAAQAPTPAYAGDFPDPSILVDGDTYWAYATGSGGRDLQVMASPDLQRWSPPTEALAGLPAWAARGFTWAPEVTHVGGRYVMYYTLRDAASGLQCISVAVAGTPAGPFVDTRDGPLVFQVDRAGSIDPSVFRSGETRFLLWKSEENARRRPTHLWGRALSADGLALTGPPEQLLLDQDRGWQRGVIEGPAMVAADGDLHLFYGAGPWATDSAGVGHAVGRQPLGPFTNRSRAGPWLGSRPGAHGPSGPAPFTDTAGATRLAYHAWPGAVGYRNGGVRALFIGRLRFEDGQPTLE
jgi:beta-xylosidase